jgi:outer membrane protein assembly factor BamB
MRPWQPRPRQCLRTGIRHFGCASAVIDGQPVLYVTGEQGGAGGRPVLVALTAGGEVLWRDDMAAERSGFAMGSQPHVLELNGGRLATAHFVAHRQGGGDGMLRLLSADNGRELWRASSGTFYGGNRDVHALDLDGDGDVEILAGFADRLACYRAADGALLWLRSERTRICWGRSAIGDIDGDGRPEIVLGSEYANPDQTSSITVLRADGSLLWEYGGIEGDCGSTPTFLLDVDGCGRPEILKTEIDLEGRGPVHKARLWCLRADGTLAWRCGTGGGDLAIGDVDGDGLPEAIHLTNGRDGGHGVMPAVRCVSLALGTVRWQTPIADHWLSGWPLLADLNGDGRLEAVLPHGSPSGYGRQPGGRAWGQVCIVAADGPILSILNYPDWVLCPLVFDWDGDDAAELIVPCGDGCIHTYEAGGAG